MPVHDDRLLFELLNLEGAQAGLSWLTILKKRPHYRKVFDNFQASKIVTYDAGKRAKLLGDTGIVRNRLKINAVIRNAKAVLEIKKEYGSFDSYIWQFVNNRPLTHRQRAKAVTVSKQMSKEMLQRGFTFFGPTIAYAFMQAVGMINDHTPNCFRSREIRLRKD